MTDKREGHELAARAAGESLEAARLRVRAIGVREVRRRGRRRTMTRASVVAVLAMGVVGVVGLSQFGRGRNLLLDDVVHDVNVIENIINAKSRYHLQKVRAK